MRCDEAAERGRNPRQPRLRRLLFRNHRKTERSRETMHAEFMFVLFILKLIVYMCRDPVSSSRCGLLVQLASRALSLHHARKRSLQCFLCLGNASSSFKRSTFDLIIPHCLYLQNVSFLGVEMHVISDSVIYDAKLLCEFVERRSITRMLFTPSLLETVLDSLGDRVSDLLKSLK